MALSMYSVYKAWRRDVAAERAAAAKEEDMRSVSSQQGKEMAITALPLRRKRTCRSATAD